MFKTAAFAIGLNILALPLMIGPCAAQQITIMPTPPQGFDVRSASPMVLENYGLPPRPEDPARLQQWERDVSIPRSTRPIIGPMPTLRHGPVKAIGAITHPNFNSGNWSGFAEVSNPANIGTITQSLTVPNISSHDGGQDWVSIWPGYDGFVTGSNDVLQAGVDCYTGPTTCFAWAEYFPDATIGLFYTYPGNYVVTYVWHTASAPHGHVYIADYTSGQSVSGGFDCTVCGSDPFTGSSVEWIIEAPSVNGTVAILANYGHTTIGNAYSGAYEPSDSAAYNITMVQGGVAVSTVSIIGPVNFQGTAY